MGQDDYTKRYSLNKVIFIKFTNLETTQLKHAQNIVSFNMVIIILHINAEWEIMFTIKHPVFTILPHGGAS